MIDSSVLRKKCDSYLDSLCNKIDERCVGSEGNREATRFFRKQMETLGWETEEQEFDAVDWRDGGASLTADGTEFRVHVSPYSRGVVAEAELVGAGTIDELEKTDFQGKILLMHGEIAAEQLMPKNFVFYNPEEHQKTIALLEKGNPRVIVCATSRNAALAGGVYPFPLIEDGDFDIPSVYMTEEEGVKLAGYIGKRVSLRSDSERIPGKGSNVIGRKGPAGADRVVVTAHIDAKKGTPGAIDNATGIATELLLAELLAGYAGARQVEIVAFNGEDYYAVSGQMKYIAENQGRFENILLNINIDGAGYKRGPSSFALFDLPEGPRKNAAQVIEQFDGIVEGPQWPQGDHSIFLQYGRPAIAVSSDWFIENIDNQDITHTPKDNLEIVDSRKVVEIAEALQKFIQAL